MKSSIDILSNLYQLLNVTAVTDVISGDIYIGDIPDGNQLENISIQTLTNSNQYLQSGFINLNIYLKEIESGRANLAKFKQLINIIIPLVKDTQTDEVYFQIDDDKGIFKDQDRDSMYFYNLKLTFQTL